MQEKSDVDSPIRHEIPIAALNRASGRTFPVGRAIKMEIPFEDASPDSRQLWENGA
jgi:hypothetical protein